MNISPNLPGGPTGPLSQYRQWRDGAISKHSDAEKEAKQKADAAEAQRKAETYSSTLESFTKGFERVSSLDNVPVGREKDLDPKPGSVDVPGVGSIKPTDNGFILSVATDEIYVLDGKAYPVRERFTVNEERNEMKYEQSVPRHIGGDPKDYMFYKTRHGADIDLTNKTITKEWFPPFRT